MKATEWPSLIVEDCNIEGGYEGAGNVDEDPGFRENGFSGVIRSDRFKPEHVVTVLVIEEALPKDDERSGRVIRVGERWSVIKETRKKEIIVWGDVWNATDEASNFVIISTYQR